MFDAHRAFARVASLAVVPLVLAAQGEKVSLRPVPAPNQTIKSKVTQEMDLELTTTGMPADAGIAQGPRKLLGRTVFEATQTVGSLDAEGRVSVDFTYDQVSAEITMDGRANPPPNTLDSLKGKTFTMIFDAQGKVVDFKSPDDLTATAPTFNEWMKAITGMLPPVTLGVGETVTVPLNVPLPVPMPGEPLSMVGQTTFTLRSVVMALSASPAWIKNWTRR